MAADHTVFLFDVDNTLLDNDRVVADLMQHLETAIGHEHQRRYWEYFEQLRKELGYADYLGALQRYRIDNPREFNIVAVSRYLLNYQFAPRLFPKSIEIIAKFNQQSEVAILSDGDVVFQPHKIERSGLGKAVDEKVMIYIHKERELDDVRTRFPADHYVLIDDKLRILAAVKQAWGPQVTTVFPKQGHYANDAAETAKYPPADVSLDRIDQLLGYDTAKLLDAAKPA
ncbi:MAG TPA: HAD family hydrolase [Candidatus Binataceae bacterium]|nr:HAD family hydrolase [Candidatus Binataceae bacterium]